MTYQRPPEPEPNKKKPIDPSPQPTQSEASGLIPKEDLDKAYQKIGNALKEYDQLKKLNPETGFYKLFERYVNSLKKRKS